MSYKSVIHKKIRIFPILVCSLLFLTGCLGEDYSGCLPPGCGIVFKYVNHTDNETTDRFLNDLKKVDLFIYDTNNKFVQRIEKDVASLAETNCRLQLDLTPGTYYISAWGNLSDEVNLSGEFIPQQTNFYDTTLSLSDTRTTRSVTHSLTPLFFGTAITVVETNKVRTDTVSFMKNTNNIRVAVNWQDKFGKPCTHDCPKRLSFRLVDTNGAYYLDNSLAVPRKSVEYKPYSICYSDSILYKESGYVPVKQSKLTRADAQHNDSTMVVADITTARLFDQWRGASLIIEHYYEGDNTPYKETRHDLMELIQAHPLLQTQAALDHYDKFTIDFTFRCDNDTQVAAGIKVADWHVVIINQDFW